MRRWIAITTLAMTLGSSAGCYENVERLEGTAKAYVQKLGYQPIGVSCMNRDSDDDGYVSCTVTVNGLDAPLAVECASRWRLLTNGCKLQRNGRLTKVIRTTARIVAQEVTR